MKGNVRDNALCENVTRLRLFQEWPVILSGEPRQLHHLFLGSTLYQPASVITSEADGRITRTPSKQRPKMTKAVGQSIAKLFMPHAITHRALSTNMQSTGIHNLDIVYSNLGFNFRMPTHKDRWCHVSITDFGAVLIQRSSPARRTSGKPGASISIAEFIRLLRVIALFPRPAPSKSVRTTGKDQCLSWQTA